MGERLNLLELKSLSKEITEDFNSANAGNREVRKLGVRLTDWGAEFEKAQAAIEADLVFIETFDWEVWK